MKFLFSAFDKDHHSGDSGFIYEKDARGVVLLRNIPGDLGKYYAADYPAYDISAFEDSVRKYEWRIRFIQQFKQSGDYLEIGPGAGATVQSAKEAGFAVSTIEADSESCQRLRARGIPAVQSFHPERDIVGQYDVITLFHVIEHVYDPFALLESISVHLKPGGIAVIATPNPDSFSFKLFGKYWALLRAPVHLTLIPLPILTEEARKYGLTKKFSTTHDQDGLGLNMIGWYDSLKHLMRPGLMLRIACKGLYLLFMLPERWFDNGAAYTVVYEKKA